MKKTDRILSYEEFAEIRKNGTRVRSGSFLISYRKGSTGRARVGISVSKKNGNAVIRNLIKRQVRAAIDDCLDYSSGLDIVITARYGYDTAKGRENAAELAAELKAIGATNIE